MYASMENVFVSIAKGEGNGNMKESLFKMTKAEQVVLESFLQARNNALLFGKCNFDKNGKCTVFEPDSGRPIPMGDGIIAQIERFASRYVFSKLSVNVFNTAINQMVEKTAKTTGNSIVFLCNQKMWQMVNDTLREYLRDWKTNGTFLYSKAAGGDVKVGATYSSYEYAGNTVTFQVDKSLTMWYPDKAYGLFLDLTADKTTGQPAI
jgi:hypothetical protein